MLLALLIGTVTGVLSGFVGIGGGAILVPALVYAFGMSQHEAQGTSLATLLLPIGLLAFWEYYRAGQVDLRLAAAIALGFTMGAYGGGHWAQGVSDVLLRKTFAVVLVGLAVKMWWG